MILQEFAFKRMPCVSRFQTGLFQQCLDFKKIQEVMYLDQMLLHFYLNNCLQRSKSGIWWLYFPCSSKAYISDHQVPIQGHCLRKLWYSWMMKTYWESVTLGEGSWWFIVLFHFSSIPLLPVCICNCQFSVFNTPTTCCHAQLLDKFVCLQNYKSKKLSPIYKLSQ